MLLWVETVAPSRNDDPMMTMSPATVGRRMDANLAALEIDLLVHALVTTPDLQVDDAAGAERLDQRAGLGVELDEPVAGRHVDDPLVAFAVGPVQTRRDPTAAAATRPRVCLRGGCAPSSPRPFCRRATRPNRRVPPVVYSIPLTMTGVPSSLYSGRGPRLSVLNRHATCSLLKFDALI